MKKIGFICEYNPLHNGHLYHFNEVKKQSEGDLFILSLSSSFTQRGDLSIIDKFSKAKHALLMGMDLVIECPTIRSMQKASTFAYFHVKNLSLAGVDEIWIGSELNDTDLYKKYLDVISTSDFKLKQREYLDNGYSLKLSFSKALGYFKLKELKSNDLLGLYYQEAINQINPSIKLKTIKRVNNNYNDTSLNTSLIQSATAIRKNLLKAREFVPEFVFDDLRVNFNEEYLLPFIKYQITTNKHLSELLEATEGIENKLFEILNLNSINDSITKIKSKRYSESKIKRLLMNTLLNITKKDFEDSKDECFLRVLGFNKKGQSLLKELKGCVEIYTNIKDGINKTLDIELKVSRIIDNIYTRKLLKSEQRGPIMIKGVD